jgi:hypothetical protein
VSELACGCGLVAADSDELADHLGQMFIPADDVGIDGRPHAERFRPGADGSRRACLCGFAATGIAAFDAHLLAVFTPADGIGQDGQQHARRGEPAPAPAPDSGIPGSPWPLHLAASGVDPAITGEPPEERAAFRGSSVPAGNAASVEPGGPGPS